MQFKSEINVGSILTIIMMTVAGFGAWTNTQAKLAHMEAEIHALKETDKEIKSQSLKTEAYIVKTLDEMKIDLRELRNRAEGRGSK